MVQLNEYFKENKKKVLKIGISSVLFLVLAFFTIAYISGKAVTEEVSMQWVSHTEYWSDDYASTIVRLADYKGQPIDVDSCQVTILYPDKSTFVEAGAMSHSNIDGNWYRTDSLKGNPLGTYEQEVTCIKGTQTIVSSQSFHLNPALEEISAISNKSNLLNESLFTFDIGLTGTIQSTNESINTHISVTESNLNTAIESARQQILTNLDEQEVNTNSKLSNVNATILSSIDNLGLNLNDNLNQVNTSLNSFLDSIQNQLSSQMNDLLENLTIQLNNIKNDTSWIVTNSMNQQDMQQIVNRFNSVDNNLANILSYCSEASNSSALCTELYSLRDSVALLRQEQNTRLDEIDQTTSNTWELLSGSVSERIDSILIALNIIQEQNREINQTTHEVLDEIQGKINVNIIS